MIVIGSILSVFSIGFFCWLLFALAIYALPFFAGMTAGLAAILRCAPAFGHPTASAMGTPTGGYVVDRLRPADRLRGRGGCGFENSKEK